jgi:site-specific recombinase XerD
LRIEISLRFGKKYDYLRKLGKVLLSLKGKILRKNPCMTVRVRNVGYIEIHRVKNGHDSIHPLRSPELRALRQIQRDYPDSSYVFVSERKAPLSTRSIGHIIARAGEIAKIAWTVHPHQLRHACGHYLAAQGHDTRAIQDYLGHKNIHHTVRYTQMSPQRFENFWRD